MANNRKKNKVKAATIQVQPQVIQVQSVPASQPSRRRPRRRRRAATRGNNMDGIMAPVAIGRVSTTPSSKVVTITNSDYLDSASFTGASKPGDVLVDLPLGPSYWPDTHAGSIAALYEKFRFTKLEVTVSARVPTSIAGGYMAGIDKDPDRDIGSNARKFVRSIEGSVSAPFWTSTTVRTKLDNVWRYTSKPPGSEERWSSVGNLYVVVDIPPSNSSGSFIMSVEVKYTLQLAGPISGTIGDDTRKTWVINAAVSASLNDATANKDKGLGLKAAGDLEKFWDSAAYERIYKIHPAIDISGGQTKAYFGDQEVKPQFLRVSKTGVGEKALLFFDTEANARAVGSNPSRDSAKMVRWRNDPDIDKGVVSSVLLPAFTLLEEK